MWIFYLRQVFFFFDFLVSYSKQHTGYNFYIMLNLIRGKVKIREKQKLLDMGYIPFIKGNGTLLCYSINLDKKSMSKNIINNDINKNMIDIFWIFMLFSNKVKTIWAAIFMLKFFFRKCYVLLKWQKYHVFKVMLAISLWEKRLGSKQNWIIVVPY